MLKIRFPLPVFRSAKEIVNGENSRMALKGLVSNKTLLIVSQSFKDSKYFDQVKRLINAQALKVVIKNWVGEPSMHDLAFLIKELEIFQPDYIVALGGGSVIDGARVAWLFYEHPTLERETLFRPFSLPPLRGRANFAAIPTTIGTGGEVSSAAVIFDEVTKRKRAVVTHDFLPDLVILDPELVTDVPISVLKPTIADALSHAVEGYVSNIKHPLMASFAEKSVEIIARHSGSFLETSWSLEMISDLQHAAMLAGWVQNHCVVGFSHAIAHQLGQYNIGHGVANGKLMPSVIEFNSRDDLIKNQYRELCARANLGGIGGLKGLFDTLCDDVDISLQLTEEELITISSGALLDPAAKTNPRVFTEIDIREIVLDVFRN
jgi:alcohol dehydrogenase